MVISVHCWGLRLLTVICLALAGCATDPVGDIVPVKGRVFVGDKPLTTGVVIYHPDAAKDNNTLHEPRGRIDDQGNYDLMTVNKPGVPPGWYKVAVVAQKLANDKVHGHAPVVWLIDTKYANPQTSGLTVQVVENPPADAYDLKLH